MIMAADPRAIARHYVPDDRGVLALSPVLSPRGQYTVYFDAPRKSGVYPIVCTFPGHWQVMRGALIVAREGEEIVVPDDNGGGRRFVKMWKTEDLAADAANLAGHSMDRGRAVFDSAGCIKCHVVAAKGAKLGPDLTEVAKRFQGAKMLEQILDPSSEIHKDYQTPCLYDERRRDRHGAHCSRRRRFDSSSPQPAQAPGSHGDSKIES